MKPVATEKGSFKKNGYQSDDENVRYKLNMDYFENINKTKVKKVDKVEKLNEDEDVRYKLPTVILSRTKLPEQKPKPKQKIKVNFWSNKSTVTRLHNTDRTKEKTNRRHTVAATAEDNIKPKHSSVKVRKRVSFLPSPIFSDNHIPMVTVPDDLTIQLNEEEANDLADDLNLAFVNSNSIKVNNSPKRKQKNAIDSNPRETKRKRSIDDLDRNQGNENELEFFSKYVVQKLRRMETNQRIYSENLINTVLMLGQLGKLNGKTRVFDA